MTDEAGEIMRSVIGHKTCTRCQRSLPFEAFKQRWDGYGLMPWCAECKREHDRDYNKRVGGPRRNRARAAKRAAIWEPGP